MSKVSNEQKNMINHLQDNLEIEQTKTSIVSANNKFLNSEGYQHTFSCWK